MIIDLKPATQQLNDYRSKAVTPRETLLAKLGELMDDIDARYEMKETRDELAVSWSHATQSRGWK